jgi:hypothetical protein
VEKSSSLMGLPQSVPSTIMSSTPRRRIDDFQLSQKIRKSRAVVPVKVVHDVRDSCRFILVPPFLLFVILNGYRMLECIEMVELILDPLFNYNNELSRCRSCNLGLWLDVRSCN